MNKTIKTAVEIAKGILEKKIDPNNGCAQISALSQKYNSPHELQIFEILACEQCGHEHIGITSENTIPLIAEACEQLVSHHR